MGGVEGRAWPLKMRRNGSLGRERLRVDFGLEGGDKGMVWVLRDKTREHLRIGAVRVKTMVVSELWVLR